MGNSTQDRAASMQENDDEGSGSVSLRLYVTGATPNSLRAITNIRNICENYIKGKYSLEIIDVYKNEDIASREQLVALPLLVRSEPLPVKRLIGDLSNLEKVLRVLGLKTE